MLDNRPGLQRGRRLGYRFQRFTLSILASNLGNRRDAVQPSELGEQPFYRLPARRADTTLTWQYK